MRSEQHFISRLHSSDSQRQTFVPFGVGWTVGFGGFLALSLWCHFHIDGRSKPVLLPLEFGTGNCHMQTDTHSASEETTSLPVDVRVLLPTACSSLTLLLQSLLEEPVAMTSNTPHTPSTTGPEWTHAHMQIITNITWHLHTLRFSPQQQYCTIHCTFCINVMFLACVIVHYKIQNAVHDTYKRKPSALHPQTTQQIKTFCWNMNSQLMCERRPWIVSRHCEPWFTATTHSHQL